VRRQGLEPRTRGLRARLIQDHQLLHGTVRCRFLLSCNGFRDPPLSGAATRCHPVPELPSTHRSHIGRASGWMTDTVSNGAPRGRCRTPAVPWTSGRHDQVGPTRRALRAVPDRAHRHPRPGPASTTGSSTMTATAAPWRSRSRQATPSNRDEHIASTSAGAASSGPSPRTRGARVEAVRSDGRSVWWA
jgi:hypothetical protein